MNRDEIFKGVAASLAEVLEIDAAEIKITDKVVGDLGADSLDLLDLIFHLEQRFKLQINPRDIEREAQAELGEIPYEVEGVYTPEALGKLRTAMPEVPAEELTEGLEAKYLPRVFRVETFVSLVERMMKKEGMK